MTRHGALLPGTNYKLIDTGFYRVTDAEAGRLAKATPLKRLPRRGYELRVTLTNGRTAWLQRTAHQYYRDSPQRGWVWAVYGIHNPVEKPIGKPTN